MSYDEEKPDAESNEQVVKRYCTETKQRLLVAKERYEKACAVMQEAEQYLAEAQRNHEILMNLMSTYTNDIPTEPSSDKSYRPLSR